MKSKKKNQGIWYEAFMETTKGHLFSSTIGFKANSEEEAKEIVEQMRKSLSFAGKMNTEMNRNK